MESMLWNRMTAEQAMALEDATKNPFLPGSLHSAEYFADLSRRREQYSICRPENRQEFLRCFQSGRITIVVGDTGCGKITQLVQFILFDEWMHDEKIVGCTQPRGSTASSAAAQVASEMELPLGGIVGCYTHSGDWDRSSGDTRLKFLTDSFLLQEFVSRRGFHDYGCIVIDQAHERTLATDMLMGLLKDATRARDDLKVVIVLDVDTGLDKFTKFFGTRNVFRVAERANAIQIRYLEEETPDALTTACSLMIVRSKPRGNILLFLTSDRDVWGACERLGRDVRTLKTLPLSQVPASPDALQDDGAQKCFVTTGLAEVSVKIPEITYVIDKGRCRQFRYSPRVGMYTLMTVPIPKPTAQLRAAQISRNQQGGICYRLYTKQTFNWICPPNNHLAIHASEMTREILMLKSCGYHEISKFNFVDRPHTETILRALAELRALGFTDSDTNITRKGEIAVCLPTPIDPAWYNAFLEAEKLGCLGEIVTIACLLSSQEDLFVRPYEQRYSVDVKRQCFGHIDSDHLARLNAFLAYFHRRDICSDEAELSNWCQSQGINLEVAEEARLMRGGLMPEVSHGMLYGGPVPTLDPRDPDFSAKIRQSLAVGFCHKTAILSRRGDDNYKTVHENYPVALEPDSCLIGMGWEWVVYHHIRFARVQYMHCITAIEPEWIMDHNLARKYDQVTLRNPEVKASLDRARAKTESESV
ncbi:uncharacterized protein NECHADRAFT_76709 [Fusarium vanettenii 77-13-4]|uniref:Helicase ATP-binding domain-containing protein n=1 Tax=Fusarium vanettenii (strain ATCC MYA-4622 / CBS 123669 / FGSC 9596 / NRRL 45880 / 77-13-4) TaxID=660122 RepID=C7Z511_FUSV7|nr:uncharacterized protein NECHADRAFT_76709 [Fusarium vanettenii 77-13-4]EEU40439.1 hypothetical protein NECHADRAFT_76709 [Fusarium vanettenii 77-13-4]